AEEADLPLVLQADHRAHRILDRHVGIDAMLVTKVDHLDPEPPEARLARQADVGRIAFDSEELALGPTNIAELGCEEDLVAAIADRPADELLVPADTVHVGGVEEGHAAIDRMVDRGDRLAVVAGAVELAHPHAAKADGRDFGLVAAETPLTDLMHGLLPFQPPSRRRTSSTSNGMAMRL